MNTSHSRRPVRLGFLTMLGALLAANAWAQYCPVETTYFTTNYFTACTVGSCWAKTSFPGSIQVSGSYPGTYYACATSTVPPGAAENTLYTYDSNGNLTSIKDPFGKVTTNEYDPLNRLKKMIEPAA